MATSMILNKFFSHGKNRISSTSCRKGCVRLRQILILMFINSAQLLICHHFFRASCTLIQISKNQFADMSLTFTRKELIEKIHSMSSYRPGSSEYPEKVLQALQDFVSSYYVANGLSFDEAKFKSNESVLYEKNYFSKKVATPLFWPRAKSNLTSLFKK